MKTTTIEIFTEDAQWWKDCKRLSGLGSPELFHRLKEACMLKKQAEFYVKKMAMPNNFKKSLSGVKIKKNYRK